MSGQVTSRDYAGPADLRAMQALTSRCWSLDDRHHVGGLAWQRFEHVGREAEWPTRLWEIGGEVVAWGWIYEGDPDQLYLQVDPAHASLTPDVLTWFEATASADRLGVEVSDRQVGLISVLEARGFARRVSGPFGLVNIRSLTDLPALEPGPGFVVRTMADAPDPDRRAAAHRAAWSRIAGRENEPPGRSRVTGESYRQVMAAWPYRPELDVVLEAPDGRWVANCCAWLDEANSIGELEPVGTDADCRRQGHGHTVCLAALHALRGAGATSAIVGARGDDAYPVPRRLYFGLGFITYARDVTYERGRVT